MIYGDPVRGFAIMLEVSWSKYGSYWAMFLFRPLNATLAVSSA